MHTIRLLPLLGSLIVAAVQIAAAQPLPLAPSKVALELVAKDGDNNRWEVGPVTLVLPGSWTDGSKSHLALLAGPQDSIASFVAAEATKEAIRSGYSLMTDPVRGPTSDHRLVDWSECVGSSDREMQTAELVGATAVTAVCPVARSQAGSESFARVTLYSATRLVQVQVVGNRETVRQFLKAIENAVVAQ